MKMSNVCQNFFLGTLGYTSNKKILHVFNKVNPGDISASVDLRGKHPPPPPPPSNKIKHDVIDMIEKHIESCSIM